MSKYQEADLDTSFVDQLIGYNLRRAYMAMARDFLQILAGVDLGPVQFSILTLIEANPGSTQNIIANAVSIKRTNFVALLDGLEAQGFAERRPSPTDRRSHALYLTPAGHALLADLKPRVLAHEQRFNTILTDADKAQLIDLLRRLRQVDGGEIADADKDIPSV